MIKFRPGSGFCDRCNKGARTLTIYECDEQVEICKTCLDDGDFSHYASKSDGKPTIAFDEITQMTLDVGAAMHRLGIPVWYNEDFNVIRYTIIEGYLRDWRSYEVGRYLSYVKWWELKQTHPYWKDIPDPNKKFLNMKITVKDEFKSASHLNYDGEWNSYFYNNLTSLPYFKCEHMQYAYPARLCPSCINKHELQLSYHQAILNIPTESIDKIKELFSANCFIEELRSS